MTSVIAQAVGGRVASAQVLLPALVNGGVVSPGFFPSDIIVLEVAAVGCGIGYPEGCFVGLIVEEAVVADYLAVIRIGVGYYLLVGVRSVVAAGFRAAVGFGECVVAVAAFIFGVAYAH